MAGNKEFFTFLWKPPVVRSAAAPEALYVAHGASGGVNSLKVFFSVGET
ncbi:hypothetical protein SAMN05216203_2670 [Marinobacter daqiaonensis]|uniref:Uncharacterized protein n=1 Tax=Marinobacter daqiaonensis TaxID=650891 RepID=A0A1I6J583_9GAMM|nr:hypothetical protein SAMN05216203_2670 [Marinobacter daqiaonensis]